MIECTTVRTPSSAGCENNGQANDPIRSSTAYRRRGTSRSSQLTNGWVDEANSGSSGREQAVTDGRDDAAEAEAALAQGIASSLRTLVIASFRAPPNKFVLGEARVGGGRKSYNATRIVR